MPKYSDLQLIPFAAGQTVCQDFVLQNVGATRSCAEGFGTFVFEEGSNQTFINFNEDGIANGADFFAWQRGFGIGSTHTQGDGTPVSVAFIDCDNFKTVNDTWGHLEGDMLLKAIAETMRESVRTMDTLARMGGDEFAVLLPKASQQDAKGVIDRLCEKLRERMELSEWPVKALTICITGSDDDGNPRERSPRVRMTALAALQNCQCKNCQNRSEPASSPLPRPEYPMGMLSDSSHVRPVTYQNSSPSSPSLEQAPTATQTPFYAPRAFHIMSEAQGSLLEIWKRSAE